MENFELARAAVRPGGNRNVAVATDSPEAGKHFLSVVDAQTILASENPVVCDLQVSEHISDIKWLNAETLLGACGRGNLKLFKFDAAAKTLKHIGQVSLHKC